MRRVTWELLVAVAVLAACSDGGGGATVAVSSAATEPAPSAVAPEDTSPTSQAAPPASDVGVAASPGGLDLHFDADGTVDASTALAALAASVGPIDGVAADPRSAGMVSGSGPYRWVARHFDEMTPEQQVAVTTVLAAAMPDAPAGFSGGAARGSGDDPGTSAYRALVDADVDAFAKLLGRTLSVPTVIHVSATADPDGAFALATRFDILGHAYPECRIWLFPKVASAGADLPFLVAHEVFHCFQDDVLSGVQWKAEPAFVMEGQAAWAGLEVGGAAEVMTDASSPGNLDHWRGWLQDPGTSLIGRAYDAVGFYSVLKDTGLNVWAVIDPMLLAGGAAGAYQAGVAGVEPDAAGRWASSLFREDTPCCSWNLRTAVGPTSRSSAVPPVTSLVVANDDSAQTDVVEPMAAGLWLLDTQADVTVIVADGWSRIGAASTFDLALQPGQQIDLCTRNGGCSCPDGTTPPPSLEVTGPVRWAVGGGGLPSQGTATGQSLEDWCRTTATTVLDTDGTGRDACELLPPDEVLAATGIALPPVLARDVTALDSCLYNDGSGAPPSWAVQASFVDPPLASLPGPDMASTDCTAFGGGYVDGPGYYACVPDLPVIFVRTVNGTAMITTTESYTHDQALALVQIVVRHL